MSGGRRKGEDATCGAGMMPVVPGGLLARSGLCTVGEPAETLGGVATMPAETGPEPRGRAADIGSFAHKAVVQARSATTYSGTRQRSADDIPV